MRRLVVLCAVLLLPAALGACGTVGMDQTLPLRARSEPPTEGALERSLLEVARTARWFGLVEASPVRQAHPLAPADWIVCAQSGSRAVAAGQSPSMALFFNGDTMVHMRTAVTLDDCTRVPYVPVTQREPPHAAGAPLEGTLGLAPPPPPPAEPRSRRWNRR